MNAVKALLIAKGVSFDERHGVSVHPRITPGLKRTFAQEGVKIHADGILPMDVVRGVQSAIVVEDYPEHQRGIRGAAYDKSWIARLAFADAGCSVEPSLTLGMN